MKLFNWESRQKQAATDKKEIIPIHEESGDIIKDREGLSIEQQDQTIIKEHLDIDDEEYRLTKNDPEKLTSLENIQDDFNLEDYIINKIDAEEFLKNNDINKEQLALYENRDDIIGETTRKINFLINKYDSITPEEWEKMDIFKKYDTQRELILELNKIRQFEIDKLTKNYQGNDIKEITGPKYFDRPDEIKQIIGKYSLTNAEWKKLNQDERKKIKNNIQTEIQELYIKKPKKMVRKNKLATDIENAA